MLSKPLLTFAAVTAVCLAGCAVSSSTAPEPVNRIDVDSHRLLGEIALAQGRRAEAAEHYLDAALAADDPAYAARTAQLANELGLDTIGHRAVARWRQLEPDSVVVSYFAGIFETRSGRVEAAVDNFGAVLEMLAESEWGAGFVQIIDALNDDPSAGAATQVMLELNRRFPGTAEGHFGLAQLAMRAGNFGLALDESEQAIELAPEWPEAQLLHARTLLLAGRSEQALGIARELADSYDNLEVRLQFAELLLSAGETQQAEDLLNEILDANPGMPEAIRALAFLSLAEEDLEDARERFEMLRGDPAYRDETFYYLGRIAELESNYLQATRAYSRVTEGNRAVESQIRAAAIMYEEMGDPASALQHLRGFGEASPRFSSEMLLARAQLLLQMDRAEEGLALIEASVDADGSIADQSLQNAHVSFYAALIDDAISRGDLEGAQLRLEESQTRYPDNQTLRYSESRLLQEQGQARRAVKVLEELVDESPNNPIFLNALGYLLTDKLNRHDRARGYIQRALAMDPESGAILDSMGWVLFKLDQYELALDYLERAYRALDVTEVLAHLVDVHWAMGDRELAQSMLDDGLAETPDDPYLNEVRSRLLQ
jgi:tetratricopeptide (TPR) repeat protein